VSNTRTVARNSLWYGVETAFSIFAAIATSVLTVRTFGPELLGYFYNLTFWTNVSGMLGSVGLAITTRKFMAEALGQGDRALAFAIFRTALRWQAWIMSAVVAVGIGLSLWLVREDFEATAIVLMLSAFPRVLNFIPSQANMAAEDMKANVPGALAGGLIQVGGTLVTLAVGWSLIGIAAAQLLGYTVEFVWKLRPLLAQAAEAGSAELPAGLLRRMRVFSTQGIGLTVLNLVVWDRSDVALLRWFNPDIRQVTFFTLPLNLIERLLLAPQTLSSAMGSTVMAEHGRDRARVVSMTATSGVYLLLIAMPLLFGAAAVAGPIWAIYGKSVSAAIPVFMLMCVLAVPKALMMPAQNLLQAAEEQGRLLWWNCVCGVIKISLDVLLIPQWGAMGAAIGNGTAQAMAGVGVWWLCWRMFGVGMRWQALAGISFSSVAMAGSVWALVNALRAWPWAGFLAGVPVGIVVFMALLRLTRTLRDEDRHRLTLVASGLPATARPLFTRVLGLIVPPPKPVQPAGDPVTE